jgi:CheY-like chemotaxis protein
MERTLSLLGAEVRSAAASADAMRELSAGGLDAMVVDLEMGGEQGYEFIGRARAMAAGSGGRTPAVAITSMGRAEDRLSTLRAGFQIHVTKPVPALELATVVANLARRSLRNAAPAAGARREKDQP